MESILKNLILIMEDADGIRVAKTGNSYVSHKRVTPCRHSNEVQEEFLSYTMWQTLKASGENRTQSYMCNCCYMLKTFALK